VASFCKAMPKAATVRTWILLAGDGFKHGSSAAFDPKNDPPLYNLYESMQFHLGLHRMGDGFLTPELSRSHS